MCFYNSQSKRALDIAKRYGRKTDIIEIVKEIIEEQHCISAFTHPQCAVVTESDRIQAYFWGLIPYWSKTPADAAKIRKMTLNARAETIFDLPSYKFAIHRQRCLIPVTGFFEFHHEGKKITPYYVFIKDNDLFSMGGIYDVWRNPETGDTVTTFTQITVPANELLSKIHNGGNNPFRMPLIISKEKEEQWLDKSLTESNIKDFFIPFDTNLIDAYAVSKDFNRKAPNDRSIILPAA